MGYHLNAVIGKLALLQAAASALPPAVVVPLMGELGLIPLSDDLFDAVNQGGIEEYEKAERRKFTYLSARIASWLKSLSVDTTIAYVEAEYFGGSGGQCAVAWRNGMEILPPTNVKEAINQALRLLGVQAAGDKDEFDTVWLGRHRTMEGWVEEGAARERFASTPKKEYTCPPFGEAVESFRRFLRDQDFSDSIHWIWREDICTRRAPGSRRSWNRRIYVNLAGTSDVTLVERYYNYGVGRNLGMTLGVFCVTAGHSCCYIYVPEDETDASYRMCSGLKLNVPNNPILAVAVTRPLLWASLRLLIGTPNNAWIDDVPRRIDAEQTAQACDGSSK